MINLQNVSVRKRHATLLSNISFTIDKGSLTVLLGPNGSGKTTLLRTIAGTMHFDGAIEIAGADLRSRKPSQLARIRAYCQQEPSFPEDMTVEQFALLGRTAYWKRFTGPTPDDRLKAEDSLEQCQIGHLRQRKLGSLSGGERRRAALAQTLAQGTPVVILDEPTSALDIGQQQAMLELVDSIRQQQETTFVLALHDLTLACQYATDVVFLQKGQLVEAGTAESVLRVKALETYYETTLADLRDGRTRAIVPRRQRPL